MNGKEIKQKYLEFFKTKLHEVIPSSSIFPENDPTVLFTTAGMQPLVPFLLGQTHPKGERLASSQKCIRTDDIEEVGDKTHHTFFEMLGNWSLGNYFKKEAIEWSFEFLTKELNIPIKKLAVTVFEGDSDAPKDIEAVEIWKSLGIDEKRIGYLPKKDNWWGPAGLTGPCGPCSEMFYYTKEEVPEIFDTDDEDWVEIWNDVFMEYVKDKEGNFKFADQKNVDTGMGLERITAVLNQTPDNYKTDLFLPIINKIEELSNKSYDENLNSMRIIADHIKAATFMLSEQKIVPSNVDQGYILRRLIRRAVRHGIKLGIKGSFTSQIAKAVIDIYPEYELEQSEKFIFNELNKEEIKFSDTLINGIREFEKISKEKKEISGQDAFLLFQSFGFPIEMTEELAKEKTLSIDIKRFFKLYKEHQELSRKGAEEKFRGGLQDNSEETTKLHTATHLLNEALRTVLSKNIKQKGSNITKERLRFDFNFDRKLTDEEKQAIEELVNEKIKESIDIIHKELPLQEALDKGYQAEFGNKYPDIVSTYAIGDFSKELCGGPHVKNTKELGKFKIKKEESSAAGIRRIKAVLE